MLIDNFYRVKNEIMCWSSCMPDKIKTEVVVPEIDEILISTCDILGVNYSEVVSKSRKSEVSFCRQLCHAVAHVMSYKYKAGWTLEYIGHSIGKRDHSTVIHSAKIICNMINTKHKIKEIMLVVDYFNLDLEDFQKEKSIWN